MTHTHKKPIIVNESGIAQVTLNHESGMSSDFGNVRFYDETETTELDYTRYTYTSDTEATFFVDCTNESNIWAYYGDSLTYTSAWQPSEAVVPVGSGDGWVKDLNNPIIDLGESGEWDDYSVYGSVPFEFNGTHYLFYAGGRNTTKPKLELSIGVATSSDGINYTKQGIVFDRSNFSGYYGLAPFSIVEVNGTYYLFCTQFKQGSGRIDYVCCYFTTTDFVNWSSPVYPSGLYSQVHAPFVMIDPTDSTKAIMYYSYLGGSNGSDLYTCCEKTNVSDLSDWTVNGTTVLFNNALGYAYPCVSYDSGVYTMYTAKQNSTASFTTHKTTSTTWNSFPLPDATQEIPNGESGEFDSNYQSIPHISGDYLYYSGRDNTYSRYNGVGRCYKGVEAKSTLIGTMEL